MKAWSQWLSEEQLEKICERLDLDGDGHLTAWDLCDSGGNKVYPGAYAVNIVDKLYLHTDLTRAKAEDLVLSIIAEDAEDER